MSIISCTSPSPSAIIFPVSSVTSWPSSCVNSRKALPRRRTVSPRTGPGVVRHFEKASCAREIALSYSSAEAVRTLASFCPLIGEILSIFAPPPRHSPSKTPALSSVSPSFSNTDVMILGRRRLACGARRFPTCAFWQKQARCLYPIDSLLTLFALLPQNFDRFVHDLFREVQRRTKA